MDMVTISKNHLEGLEKARAKLDALEQAGVDNWEGYSMAMSILGGEDDE